MIPIKKGEAPPRLEALRQKATRLMLSPKDAYHLLRKPLKTEVLNQLLQEQGHLCAYCMCEIPRSDVDPDIAPITIEHYFPRSPESGEDRGQGLDYANMLAVCNGNKADEGVHSYLDLTCDAYKKQKELRVLNPCNPETLEKISYTLDGRIVSDDDDVSYDLNKILNLNCVRSPLVEERKAALDSLIEELGYVLSESVAYGKGVDETDCDDTEYQSGDSGFGVPSVLQAFCRNRLDEYRNETDHKTSYVGILIWYLEEMLESFDKGVRL